MSDDAAVVVERVKAKNTISQVYAKTSVALSQASAVASNVYAVAVVSDLDDQVEVPFGVKTLNQYLFNTELLG